MLALLLLGAAGAYLALNYVDVFVKTALERYGPDVLGAPVKVDAVNISVRDGKGSIRGLEIGNPAGFASGRAARLGEIRVAIDPSTFTSKVVRIHELAIEAPQINYERGSKGANIDAIARNIEAYMKKAAEGDGGRKPDRAQKRRFIIDKVTIRGTRVAMQGVGFDLPHVELRDVGKRQDGLTASEVASVVTVAFQTRIAHKVLTNIELLRKGGVEGAIDALKGLIKQSP